jgi:excisionase family DNA binding protein
VQTVRSEVRAAIEEAMKPDEYISTETAAKLAEVTKETIRRWVKVGKLTPYGVKGQKKTRRTLRISRNELEQLLKNEGAKNDEMSVEDLAKKRFG